MAETGGRTPADDAGGAIEPLRILLVEDDPRAAFLIGEMLRATWTDGMILAQTKRLGDATQELLKRGATCVLLDLSLPGIDPVGAIMQARNATPDAAIIALAERADEETALRTIRAGAQDYLVKNELHPALLRRSVQYAVQRRRSEAQVAELALHDHLTGLPNRALFLDRLGVALDRSRRTDTRVAVLFLDVDYFKQINDTFGHAAGDRLLAGLADRLAGMLRPMDTVARLGGDEFIFLFEDLASEREVVLIAERISTATRMPFTFERNEISITVSIGIAIAGDSTTAAEAVIREADIAMYRAKELGPARYELFDEASRARAAERLEFESALRLAVDRGELRVHYQPRLALNVGPTVTRFGQTITDATQTVTGFEALVRWAHPQRGLISPGEFIPLAEETGIVLAIGEFVLTEALRQLSQWQRSAPGLTMSVNLSLRQLEDSGLASILAGAINTAEIDPAALCLEVSESSVAHNAEMASRVLQGLKTLGVRLAIDDYGTGATSLRSLSRLPVDVLKIHESFVTGLGSDPDGSIVGAVVELGHALGLSVVAEGVETQTQLAELRTLGCDGVQGFLFGRPVPEDEAQAMLAR